MAYRDKTNGPFPVPVNEETTMQAIDTLGVALHDDDFEGFEISARWSDDRQAVVIHVNAKRKTTPAEQSRLVEIMRDAQPNDLATVVFERWKVTLDRPLYYRAEIDIPAREIPIKLEPDHY